MQVGRGKTRAGSNTRALSRQLSMLKLMTSMLHNSCLSLACVEVVLLVHTSTWSHTGRGWLVDHSIGHSESKGLAFKMNLTVWRLAVRQNEEHATRLENTLHLHAEQGFRVRNRNDSRSCCEEEPSGSLGFVG